MGSSIAAEKDTNLGLKKQAVRKHLTCSMEVSDLYNLFPLVCPHNYQYTLFTMLLALTLAALCMNAQRKIK